MLQEGLSHAQGVMVHVNFSGERKIVVVQMAGSSKETKFELSEEEKEKRRKEAEEQKLAELRAHGIPVTTDTFSEWKRKFDTEKRLEKAKLEPQSIDKDKGPTGKQFFLTEDAAKQVCALSPFPFHFYPISTPLLLFFPSATSIVGLASD